MAGTLERRISGIASTTTMGRFRYGCWPTICRLAKSYGSSKSRRRRYAWRWPRALRTYMRIHTTHPAKSPSNDSIPSIADWCSSETYAHMMNAAIAPMPTNASTSPCSRWSMTCHTCLTKSHTQCSDISSMSCCGEWQSRCRTSTAKCSRPSASPTRARSTTSSADFPCNDASPRSSDASAAAIAGTVSCCPVKGKHRQMNIRSF